MSPVASYDLTDSNMPVERGRYAEGRVLFQDTKQYTPDEQRALTKGGALMGTYSLGDGKSSAEQVPVKAVDDAGNIVELFGEQTALVPYQNVKGQLSSAYPYFDYVDKQLEDQTYPNGARRDFGSMNNAIKPGSKVIVLDSKATMSDVEDTSDKTYNWQGRVVTGKQLHDEVRAQQQTTQEGQMGVFKNKVLKEKADLERAKLGDELKPIPAAEDMKLKDVKNDANTYYKWDNGHVETGKEIWDRANKK